MTGTQPVSALTDEDYESIAAAVAETARGRWFLAEFARRNRTADTSMLLAAIHRLETRLGGEKPMQQIERVRADLVEMAGTIAQLKHEIAADGNGSRLEQATEALDAVARTTEAATSSILEAAEQIQEMAWTLREAGADAPLCDLLDRRAGDIYTACTFQDLTAQRTRKVVQTLRFLEGRINALVDAWENEGPAPLQGMPAPDRAAAPRPLWPSLPLAEAEMSQDDIDIVIINHDSEEALAHWQAEAAPEAADPAEAAIEDEDGSDVSFAPSRPDNQAGDSQEPGPAPANLSAVDQMATTAKISLFS